MTFQRIGVEKAQEATARKRNFLEIMQEATRNGKSNVKDAEGLTIMQKAFVEEFMKHGNASRAYKEAGLSEGKDPEKTGFNACLYMKKPHIKAALDRRRQELTKTAKIDQERIILELQKIALSRLTDFFTMDTQGNISWKHPDELTDDQKACIADISIFENVVTGTRRIAKLKLHSKKDALDMLAKIMGLYEKDNKQRVPQVNIELNDIVGGMPVEIADLVKKRLVYDITAEENRTIN